jgi:hypothetical protein
MFFSTSFVLLTRSAQKVRNVFFKNADTDRTTQGRLMQNKRLSRTMEFVLWFSPLWLAILLSFTCVGHTTVDSGAYIKKAYLFTQGQLDWSLRPGFIFLLGLVFKILGSTVWAATVLIRLFFIANVALVFFITKYIFNREAAFAASLTLLSSYFLNFLSHRVLLDNIHPFFVLLAIFLSILALDRRSDKLALFAGFAFVYAYLVKSTTLLFIPFPLVLALLWDGTRLNFSKLKPVGITCITAGIGIIIYHSWLQIIETKTFAGHVLKDTSNSALDILLADSLAETLQNTLQGLVNFWERFLFHDAWLGGLFAIAWAWIFIRSARHKYSRVFPTLLILFLPAMVYLGINNLRLGQAGVFLFATFIPVGVIIHDMAGYIALLLGRHKERLLLNSATVMLIVTLAIGLCVYQIWLSDRFSKQWLQHTYAGRLIKGDKTDWTLQGEFDKRSQKAAKIIIKHAPPGATVLTGFKNSYAIDYFTGYQYATTRISTGHLKKIYSLRPVLVEKLPQKSINGRLLFLWPNRWVERLEHWNTAGELRFRFIEENDILRLFDDHLPAFLALDRRLNHLGDYFAKSPGVTRLSSNRPLFQINSLQLLDNYKPRVAYEIGMLLSQLRKVNPENYKLLRNNFFPSFFHFTPEQVDSLADLDENGAGVIFIGLPGKQY